MFVSLGADVGWKSAGERLFLRPSLPLAGLAGEKSCRIAVLPGCPAPGSARLREAHGSAQRCGKTLRHPCRRRCPFKRGGVTSPAPPPSQAVGGARGAVRRRGGRAGPGPASPWAPEASAPPRRCRRRPRGSGQGPTRPLLAPPGWAAPARCMVRRGGGGCGCAGRAGLEGPRWRGGWLVELTLCPASARCGRASRSPSVSPPVPRRGPHGSPVPTQPSAPFPLRCASPSADCPRHSLFAHIPPASPP